ncbi:glycoside hydrolase family 48 protein, partial [Staphylococcus pasteuri_A]
GGEYGFLDLFVAESQAPAKQWRYTNAPDADARAVQVMYWALQWMKERGQDPEVVAPGLMAKAAKMGDYLRLAMFDKYFKKIGSQDEQG